MSNTTNRTQLEQGRAAFAYQCAESASKNLSKPKEYKSYVKKIPMLIKTSGLGATFAFVKAKSKDGNAYELIYCQTYLYLKYFEKMGIFNKSSDEDLVQVIISQESPNYRYLTVETLAFFAWLKRFAEGLIEGEAEGGE